MAPIQYLAVVLGTALTLPHYAFAGLVQAPGLQLPASAAANRQAVKDIFTTSYQAYKFVVA